ncbi:Tn3 family transposase [Lelliottia amnigena]|uniref:Tn3 family transposase n=1 Tax=Lelliottia TaxID=1330545 RepID=UPI00192B1266|nr:Tn3 family transposase [Lelliottia aquatilis]MBL5923297.1 Tn3 family transposase [Lelliottia amnigena]MBL5932206.1 Tn3 family transposase [Lelliottia amnigena]
MDAAIQQLRRKDYQVLDSDAKKLSPLQCGHINMQGRYSFAVPESVSKGVKDTRCCRYFTGLNFWDLSSGKNTLANVSPPISSGRLSGIVSNRSAPVSATAHLAMM